MGRRKPDLWLVAAAFLFGVTFVVVQDGVETAEPFPFIAVRFLIGLLVLLPLAVTRRRTPHIWRDGIGAGIALGAGYAFQTIGLQYTTPSVSAFVTYLMVVFVPILTTVIFRRPPSALTVAGVLIAIVGLLLLTGGTGRDFGRGEWFTLGCAVAFAAHIVILSRVSHRHDTLLLTATQIGTVMTGCGVVGFFAGGYRLGPSALLAALVTGVGATALAFLLQTGAQKQVGPARTVVILLLEPVFAALLGALLGERLGWRGASGAALIMAAVVVVEVVPLLRADRIRELAAAS